MRTKADCQETAISAARGNLAVAAVNCAPGKNQGQAELH